MKNKFIFRNFTPDKQIETYANLVLKQIAAPFPEGEFTLAYMTKINDIFFGFAAFQVKERDFFAEGYSYDPKIALYKIDEVLAQQLIGEDIALFQVPIEIWRKSRIGKEL